MSLQPVGANPDRAVTWRSILLGVIGVLVINLLAPYNDGALNNTFLVGNNLPLGLIVMAFVLAVLVNGPLSVYRPRSALTAGELTVCFSMVLVGCAVASAGMMRYFPPALVMPFWHARTDAGIRDMMLQLDLPSWALPDFQSPDKATWPYDPVVEDFGRRVASTENPAVLYERIGAWVTPALTWAVFTFALWGAILFTVTLVRRQWHENERLPFPLAQIQLTLVQPPKPGRFFNDIMSRRSFWLVFAAVFILHTWNGLAVYLPRYFPVVPTEYDLRKLFMAERPWSFVTDHVQSARIYFTALGISYFLNAHVAFSLFFFVLLDSGLRMVRGSMTGEPGSPGAGDQIIGAQLAFFFVVMWIGRKHWALVVRQAFRGVRPGEPSGRYVPYPVAFWGLVICMLTMIVWLTLAGVQWYAAVAVVVLLLVLFVIIARIVAETGLVHGQLAVPLYRPWQIAEWYGWHRPVSLQSYYFTAVLESTHYDFRETVSVYGSHALKLADTTMFNHSRPDNAVDRRRGWRFMALLALALGIAYFAGLGSALWTEYRYELALDKAAGRINDWGTFWNSAGKISRSAQQYAQGNYAYAHDPVTHMAGGAAACGFLSVMRLQFSWWPLHPVGLLMMYTFPLQRLWLSIMLGWMIKGVILRFGGASLYSAARPAFMGLIVGESIAGGVWLLSAMVAAQLGLEYHAIRLNPW